jgi:hypothetical protein
VSNGDMSQLNSNSGEHNQPGETQPKQFKQLEVRMTKGEAIKAWKVEMGYNTTESLLYDILSELGVIRIMLAEILGKDWDTPCNEKGGRPVTE